MATKHDGSLIILFCHDGAWRCCTKGSWDNPQTRYVENWVRTSGFPFLLQQDFTYLFELCAPWNRIVVPYEKERMILIGSIETKTGQDTSYYDLKRFADLVGLDSCDFTKRPVSLWNPNEETGADGVEEGYVCRFSNGFRVKLKYSQYLRMHKALTGLSVKGIWDSLRHGDPDPPENMPDEFLDWHRGIVSGLTGDYKAIQDAAREAYGACIDAYTKTGERKDFAMEARKHGPLQGVLFAMLDNRDTAPIIWKMVKPTEHRTFKRDADGDSES